MVVLKNRRIRKKIYQKIPSLIQPIGHLSVSRSPNFNFTRKNLIQATIKSKNITILANERCLVKKYRNFIPFFFPLPLFLSTCEYIHNCSNHLISTNETKFARFYWLIPSIGLSLSLSLSHRDSKSRDKAVRIPWRSLNNWIPSRAQGSWWSWAGI